MSDNEKPKKENLEFAELPFVPVYHFHRNGEIVLHLENAEEFKRRRKRIEEDEE